MLVEVINLVGRHKREDVRSLIVHLHGLTSRRVDTRVAVVFHVALRAHQFRIRLLKEGDLAVKAAYTDVLHIDFGVVRIFGINRREVGARQRLNQRVAHDAGFRGVRIVAEVAVQGMRRLSGHVDDIALTRERGLLILVAHVGPIEHQIGGFAADAHGVCGCRRADTLRFLCIIVGRNVFHHTPGVEVAAAHREVEPPILRFKAAAERAVTKELIEHHKVVASEFGVFLRKAVAAQSSVKEGIRRHAFRILLRHARHAVGVRFVHRPVLILMATAAGRGRQTRLRTRFFAGGFQMCNQTRMARSAAHFFMSAGLVEISYLAVAGHAHRGVDFFLCGLCGHQRRGHRSRKQRLQKSALHRRLLVCCWRRQNRSLRRHFLCKS